VEIRANLERETYSRVLDLTLIAMSYGVSISTTKQSLALSHETIPGMRLVTVFLRYEIS